MGGVRCLLGAFSRRKAFPWHKIGRVCGVFFVPQGIHVKGGRGGKVALRVGRHTWHDVSSEASKGKRHIGCGVMCARGRRVGGKGRVSASAFLQRSANEIGDVYLGH